LILFVGGEFGALRAVADRIPVMSQQRLDFRAQRFIPAAKQGEI
jgi:hypothetical protein